MTVQRRNAELVELLRSDFEHRGNPALAWESACSAHLALPSLRGFWPMSSFNESGNAYDLSGQGRILTYNGNPRYWPYDLAPYINLDGTGDYLERADEAGLDILGTEAYVSSTYNGLTLGCWAWADTDVIDRDIISKRDGALAADIAYTLQRTAAGNIQIQVSSGAALESQASAAVMATGGWHHIIGRWEPSTDLSVFVDGVETAAGASAIAALQNHTANFQIGGRDDGAGGSTSSYDGKVSMAFLCAAALPDITLFSLYERTRRLYYV